MRFLISFSLILILSGYIFPQNNSITGTVSDKTTAQPLSDVSISVPSLNSNTVSDNSGTYTLQNLPAGELTVRFSRIGYRTEEIKINITSGSQTLNVMLTAAPVTLNEVSVVSAKFPSNVREVPLPLEIMTEKDIERLPSVSISEMLRNKPGLMLVRDGIWGTTVNIRGLSRSSIVTLIDGNRIETATDHAAGLSLIDVNNIKQIEVIKGAASSLYGTGALGGVVNIISKSGGFTDKFSYGGSLTSGYNTVNKGTSSNLSLNASSSFWYARVSGSLRNASSATTPLGILPNSQFHDNSISADLGVMPFNNHEIKIAYQRVYATDVGIPGGNTLFPSAAKVTYPTEERNLFSTEYNIKNISDVLVKLSAKYFYQFIYRDVENIPYTVTRVLNSGGQLTKETNVLKITPTASHYTNGAQLQGDLSLSENNLLIAGVDAWQRQINSNRERYIKIVDYLPVSKTTNQVVGEKPLPEAAFRSIGFFAQDEIGIIKNRLKLVLGGRYDLIHTSNKEAGNPSYTIVNGVRNDNPSNKVINWKASEADNRSWSGNADVLYTILNGLDLNVNLARSFRSPSLEERYKFIDQGTIVLLGDPQLKPEQGLYTDAGIRLYNENMNITANVFLNNLSDMVVDKAATYYDPVQAKNRPARVTVNVGKARLYGMDLGAEYSFMPAWSCYLTASVMNGRDVENNVYLPLMPPANGRLGLKLPIFTYGSADISSTLFAAQKNTAPGEFTTPGYAVFDVYLYSEPFAIGSIADLRASAGVENLTDKAYRNHLASNRGQVTVEPGRNFFVKLFISW